MLSSCMCVSSTFAPHLSDMRLLARVSGRSGAEERRHQLAQIYDEIARKSWAGRAARGDEDFNLEAACKQIDTDLLQQACALRVPLSHRHLIAFLARPAPPSMWNFLHAASSLQSLLAVSLTRQRVRATQRVGIMTRLPRPPISTGESVINPAATTTARTRAESSTRVATRAATSAAGGDSKLCFVMSYILASLPTSTFGRINREADCARSDLLGQLACHLNTQRQVGGSTFARQRQYELLPVQYL